MLEELKTRLQHAHQMEAVGRLAAGVAHEFNNLLTVILAHCENAMSAADVDARAKERFDDIRAAAQAATSLAGQLLNLSRRQPAQPRVLNVSRVVADAHRLVARMIKADIALDVRCEPHVGHIVADAVQLQQMILNLVANARDAMPRGGRLVIETRRVHIAAGDMSAYPYLPPGGYVRLAVSDTGVGMDEATRVRMFEPFFTTKSAGNGTGLGLSTVFGIVKESGGFIWATSEPGVGSTFEICFPLVDPPPVSSSR